jgi:hypothetical protein
MRLPEEDEDYLNGKGCRWQLISEGNGAWLLIIGLILAEGRFDQSQADVLIWIPDGYPTAALDMFYLSPPVKLTSGAYPDRAEHFEDHVGRRWQRFSRHPPWRAGLDGLPMFLALIQKELQ